MRRFITLCCLLVLAASCSESPPAQQAVQTLPNDTPLSSKAEPQVAESEAADVQVDAIPLGSPPAELIERTSPLVVGDQVPNFRLQDQNAADHSLDHLLADGKVALVFYRSADW